MKKVNNEVKNLHIFWTTSGISMKFSETACLMIALKVTKNSASSSLRKIHFFEKTQGGQYDSSAF